MLWIGPAWRGESRRSESKIVQGSYGELSFIVFIKAYVRGANLKGVSHYAVVTPTPWTPNTRTDSQW